MARHSPSQFSGKEQNFWLYQFEQVVDGTFQKLLLEVFGSSINKYYFSEFLKVYQDVTLVNVRRALCIIFFLLFILVSSGFLL